MKGREKAVWIAGSIAMLLGGIFVIPKLLKKYTVKIYKSSHDEIDFDNLGPEIVKKDNKEDIKNGV